MKRKYYKYTAEYIEHLKKLKLTPMGCFVETFPSHKARKRVDAAFGMHPYRRWPKKKNHKP